MNYIKKIIILIVLIFAFEPSNNLNAKILNEIEIKGNKRISSNTIILFGDIQKGSNIDNKKLNLILKNLYETNFFENVKLKLDNQKLIVTVTENPIIQSIQIVGVKNKTIIKNLNSSLTLKEKSSFVESIVKKDENSLKNILRRSGYYFSKINTLIKKNNNNTVDLTYDITLGEKAFITKIKFIGDKKIKDRKLKNVIISEESKFGNFYRIENF